MDSQKQNSFEGFDPLEKIPEQSDSNYNWSEMAAQPENLDEKR